MTPFLRDLSILSSLWDRSRLSHRYWTPRHRVLWDLCIPCSLFHHSDLSHQILLAPLDPSPLWDRSPPLGPSGPWAPWAPSHPYWPLTPQGLWHLSRPYSSQSLEYPGGLRDLYLQAAPALQSVHEVLSNL